MRAADWRVTGEVTDLPVLGVLAVKAGTGGGELRSIKVYTYVTNMETNKYLFLSIGETGLQTSNKNILTQIFNYLHHSSYPPKLLKPSNSICIMYLYILELCIWPQSIYACSVWFSKLIAITFLRVVTR
jgi:hypothetical protein